MNPMVKAVRMASQAQQAKSAQEQQSRANMSRQRDMAATMRGTQMQQQLPSGGGLDTAINKEKLMLGKMYGY